MRKIADYRTPKREHAYTVTEMMVVVAIVLTVAAVSMPVLMPIFRTSAIRAASDAFKQACVQGRSLAISSRDAAFVGLRNVTAPVREQTVFVLKPLDAQEWEATAATGNSVTVSGAAWTVDEWAGKHVLVTSGPYGGVFRRVSGNTAERLDLATAWLEPEAYPARALNRPSPGDTFRIVEAVTEESLPETTQIFVPDDPDAASPNFTHGDHTFAFSPTGSASPLGRLQLGDDGKAFWIQDVRDETGKTFHVFKTTGRVTTEEMDL